MGADQEVDRIARATRNQALLREVNERLNDIAQSFQQMTSTAVFACECVDLGCVEQIEMTADEYEAVRSKPNQFAVAPGHVHPDVEDVIRESERFIVVAKFAPGDRIAVKANPRSD
jgi:hypothetical protein